MQQHLDPVTDAMRHTASVAIAEIQLNDAIERATESVMSDMDTLHDWLYAQAVGVMVCEPYQLAQLVALGDADITECANDELLALMWNASNDLSTSARHELQNRYLAYRHADVRAKANEYLASECAA
jgi:hypothetical protein